MDDLRGKSRNLRGKLTIYVVNGSIYVVNFHLRGEFEIYRGKLIYVVNAIYVINENPSDVNCCLWERHLRGKLPFTW